MFEAQLTAWSLPTPNDSGSNLVISNFIEQLLNVNVLKKSLNEEKEAGNGPF